MDENNLFPTPQEETPVTPPQTAEEAYEAAAENAAPSEGEVTAFEEAAPTDAQATAAQAAAEAAAEAAAPSEAQPSQAQPAQEQTAQAQNVPPVNPFPYGQSAYRAAAPVPPAPAPKAAFSWMTFVICLVLCFSTLLLSAFMMLFAIGIASPDEGGTTVIYENSTVVENTGTVITDEQGVEAVNRCKNSVVEIEVAISRDSYEAGNIVGAGSGVVWSGGEGATFSYIVTNNHVVEGASYFSVTTAAGDKLEATLVGADLYSDLAVLRVHRVLTPVNVSQNSEIKEGMTVLAIGNPLGTLGGTKTFGKISAITREIEIDGITMTLLQHDAAVNSGNSGGGLFDIHGRLVGIVNAKTSGTGVEGLGFAIPIDTVKDVASQIIAKGFVSGRPQLGITILSYSDVNSVYKSQYDEEYPGLSSYLYYSGLYVVAPEAQNAQFKFGDYIYKMDGQDITSMDDIRKILSNHKVGDTIQVNVLRDGHLEKVGRYQQYVYTNMILTVTLTERTN